MICFVTHVAADNVVKIWSPLTGELIRNLPWSSDGTYLASASDDTSIRIWNVETVRSSLLPAITVCRRMWNITTGQCFRGARCRMICPVLPTRHTDRPRPTANGSQHVQFSNSQYILSTAHDSAIRLWDYHTLHCLETYIGHRNEKCCFAACFSVMGKMDRLR